MVSTANLTDNGARLRSLDGIKSACSLASCGHCPVLSESKKLFQSAKYGLHSPMPVISSSVMVAPKNQGSIVAAKPERVAHGIFNGFSCVFQ